MRIWGGKNNYRIGLKVFLFCFCITMQWLYPHASHAFFHTAHIQSVSWDTHQSKLLISPDSLLPVGRVSMNHLTGPERLVIDISNASLANTVPAQLDVHQNGISRIEIIQSTGIIYHNVEMVIYGDNPAVLNGMSVAASGTQIAIASPNLATISNIRQTVNPYPFTSRSADNPAVMRSVRATGNSLVFITDPGKHLTLKNQFMLSNPGRYVIDLGGAVLPATNTLIMPDGSLKTLPIHTIRLGQFDANTVRVVIETAQPARFQARFLSPDQNQLALSYTPLGTTLGSPGPVITHTVPKTSVHHSFFTVVVDAGHGGKDYGAIRDGVNEKDLNLSVALRVKQALEAKGYTVYMRRNSDRFDDLPQISAFTNRMRPDVFVSIHTNASNSPQAQGMETYYYTPQSFGLARAVQRQLTLTVPESDRGIQNARFYVIHHTAVPAILCEMGYISNPSERLALQTVQRQKQIAEGIAQGVSVFLQHTLQAQLPNN